MLRATCRIGLLLALCALPSWRVAHAQQAGDVPYVQTPSNVIDAMLDMALVNANDYLIDLGSGDGRIVIEAAKKNGAHGMGVELDENLVFTARQEARRQGVGGKATFVAGNLFNADISRATVLTMYLLGQINIQLRPRLLSELKPGTRVVSHDFDMGNWKPDLQREMPVPNKSYGPPVSRIYLWYVPANAAGKWRWQLTVGGNARVYEARVRQFFQEIDGEMLIDGGSVAAQNVRLRGDLISFNLTREMFGQQISHAFNGRIEGDKILGRVTVSGGEHTTLDWQATRTERGKMRTE
jgi:ubiquinone/menaquinone biosynthesis C-methylase UbiE